MSYEEWQNRNHQEEEQEKNKEIMERIYKEYWNI